MKKLRYPLYVALAISIFTIVSLTMGVNAAYTYSQTKNKTIEQIKERSRTTILSLKDNVKNFMAAYAINEYKHLVANEIKRRNIFAIVIEDYNMGEILGKKAFVSGEIKYSDKNIVPFNPQDKEQQKALADCFYSEMYDITSNNGKILGTIRIYISDTQMQAQLSSIISETIKNAIILSFILIIALLFTIKVFILKPLYTMIEAISKRDDDGIPINLVSYHAITEVNKLSETINNMIKSIKVSRNILQKERHKLESLLNLSPIAIRVVRTDGSDVIYANDSYRKLLQLETNDAIHLNPKEYYAQASDYENIIEELKHKETIYNRLVELNIKDEKVWALGSYMNINFEGEKASIGWFYNVTKEKENEDKLYEALELQTALFDNSGYMLIRTDKDGIIKQINKETERLTGYKAEELIDIHTPELFHLKSEMEQRAKALSLKYNQTIKPTFELFLIDSKMGTKNEYEWTYVTKKGEHIPVLITISALKDKNNEIYGYLGFGRNISERKLIESQSKLASMGEMIGNIAHQWRQPLSVISTTASGVKLQSEIDILSKEELVHDMDVVMNQALFLSRTIDDFRDFIKHQDKQTDVLLSDVIKKTLSLINATIKNNDIEVILDLQEDGVMKAFENQLIQAFINILNNSKDAMKENTNDKMRLIFISTQKIDSDLTLKIKDSGGGIDSKIMDNIFDPYFTTKHKSIGTGIGLSMTHQILTKHHNGIIKVYNTSYNYKNRSHKGACFEITFKA